MRRLDGHKMDGPPKWEFHEPKEADMCFYGLTLYTDPNCETISPERTPIDGVKGYPTEFGQYMTVDCIYNGFEMVFNKDPTNDWRANEVYYYNPVV